MAATTAAATATTTTAATTRRRQRWRRRRVVERPDGSGARRENLVGRRRGAHIYGTRATRLRDAAAALLRVRQPVAGERPTARDYQTINSSRSLATRVARRRRARIILSRFRWPRLKTNSAPLALFSFFKLFAALLLVQKVLTLRLADFERSPFTSARKKSRRVFCLHVVHGFEPRHRRVIAFSRQTARRGAARLLRMQTSMRERDDSTTPQVGGCWPRAFFQPPNLASSPPPPPPSAHLPDVYAAAALAIAKHHFGADVAAAAASRSSQRASTSGKKSPVGAQINLQKVGRRTSHVSGENGGVLPATAHHDALATSRRRRRAKNEAQSNGFQSPPTRRARAKLLHHKISGCFRSRVARQKNWSSGKFEGVAGWLAQEK